MKQAHIIAAKGVDFCVELEKEEMKHLRQGAIYSMLCMLKDKFGEDFEEPLIFFLLAHGDLNKEESNESHH